MKGRRIFGVGAALAMLLTAAGCTLNPAAKGAEELHAYFTQTYPEHVLDTATSSTNELPAMGSLYAVVLLAPDTPPEMLQQIYQDLVDYEAPSRVGYTPIGVEANGVGICVRDPDQEQKRELRQALLDAQASLSGSWACPRHGQALNLDYIGSWEQFVADTALVQGLAPAGVADLELSARVAAGTTADDDTTATVPIAGIVTGPWSAISPAALAVMPQVLHAAVTQAGVELKEYTLDGTSLTVAVQPTGALEVAQQAADDIAGSQLAVQVTQGSTDPDRQEHFAVLAPLTDALRALPEVSEVTSNVRELRVITATAEAVPTIGAVVDAHPEATAVTRVLITVERPGQGPDGVPVRALSGYSRPAGAGADLLPTFEALLQVSGLETVSVTETAGQDPPRVVLRLSHAGDLEPVAQAKPHLPQGARLIVFGAAERGGHEFTVADRITADQVRNPAQPDSAGPLVEAWNAAP